jgi:ABC-type Fe3+ transport system, permease component
MLLGSFLMPPYLTAVAWSLLAGPAGLWNQVMGHGGLALAQLLYSLPGMAIVMALHLTPLVYVMASAALRGVDHRLIETAQVHGASPLRARWMAYRPGVAPALLAATLLVFLASTEEFGVPKVLGDMAGVQVLSVAVEQALDVWPVNLPRAAGIGLLLGTLALMIWLLALPLTRMTATSAQRRAVKTRRWCALPPLLFAVIATGLPLAAIGVTALQKAVTNGLASGNWTWKHFAQVLTPGDGGLAALQTSIGAVRRYERGRYGAGGDRPVHPSAVSRAHPKILGGAGLRAAGDSRRGDGDRTDSVLERSGQPAADLWSCAHHRHGLSGAHSPLRTALCREWFAANSGRSESGGKRARRRPPVLTQIHLPLSWPNVLAGGAVLFAFCMRELAASILLQPPGTQVISTYVYAQFDQGNVNDGMALAVVGIASTLLVLIAVRGVVQGCPRPVPRRRLRLQNRAPLIFDRSSRENPPTCCLQHRSCPFK